MPDAPMDLTAEWCVQTFYRVNPGAKQPPLFRIPSLYLLDFARAIVAQCEARHGDALKAANAETERYRGLFDQMSTIARSNAETVESRIASARVEAAREALNRACLEVFNHAPDNGECAAYNGEFGRSCMLRRFRDREYPLPAPPSVAPPEKPVAALTWMDRFPKHTATLVLDESSQIVGEVQWPHGDEDVEAFIVRGLFASAGMLGRYATVDAAKRAVESTVRQALAASVAPEGK